MTVEQITKRARTFLQDTILPYRWTEAEIQSAILEGIRTLGSMRPETRYVKGVLTDIFSLPGDPSEELNISDKYNEALVFYVLYKCYLIDNSDTANLQLAESFLSKFNTKVQL